LHEANARGQDAWNLHKRLLLCEPGMFSLAEIVSVLALQPNKSF
jgi:hypothetical protein